MVRRQIECDEETDRRLTALADEYGGDVGLALSELVQSRESIETFIDECEAANYAAFAEQKRRSEQEFREGRTVTWEEVKRRNRL
jgi:hypothetical protein